MKTGYDGAEHYRIYKKHYLVAFVVAIVLAFFNPLVGAGFALGYFLLARYIDPDLDQISVTAAEGRMMREWKIFGVFLFMYFAPYAYIMRIFGGHRSFLTHFPVISTGIRLAYLLALPAIFIFTNNIQVPVYVLFILVGVWAGLSYADFLHWVHDVLS